MKIVAVLVCIVGLVIGGVGAYLAYDLDLEIRTYTPVSATVISSNVKISRGSKGRKNYEPIVEYRYEIGNANYTSRRVLPMSRNTGRSRAEAIVRKYAAGTQTQAYINPSIPGDAFLIRQHSIFPHILTTAGLATFAVGVLLPGWSRRTLLAPEPSSGGWYVLRPSRTVGNKARSWGLGGLAWEIAVGAGLGWFVLVTERPLDNEAIWVPAVAAGLGLLPLAVAAYFWRLAGSYGEASVFVDRERMAPGSAAKARVEQMVQRGGRVEEMRVGLVCLKTVRVVKGNKSTVSTTTVHEKWLPLTTDREVMPGDTIGGQVSLGLPPDASVTTGLDEKGKPVYPAYEWFVAVRTAAHGRPDYKGWFPIVVGGGARGGGGSGGGRFARQTI